MRRQHLCLLLGCFVIAVFIAPREIIAAPYYERKIIKMVVGTPPGGGYDRMARILEKHPPKYIPGKPTIIVENMPNAASLIAANYLYNIAKPDGLSIGTFNRGIPIPQLQKIDGVRFDMMKFPWLGSASSESTLLCIRSDLPYSD